LKGKLVDSLLAFSASREPYNSVSILVYIALASAEKRMASFGVFR
jgi:hypothetical protein